MITLSAFTNWILMLRGKSIKFNEFCNEARCTYNTVENVNETTRKRSVTIGLNRHVFCTWKNKLLFFAVIITDCNSKKRNQTLENKRKFQSDEGKCKYMTMQLRIKYAIVGYCDVQKYLVEGSLHGWLANDNISVHCWRKTRSTMHGLCEDGSHSVFSCQSPGEIAI